LSGLAALEHIDMSRNELTLTIGELLHYVVAPLRDAAAASLKSLDLSDNALCTTIADLDYFLLAHLSALEFVNSRAISKEQRRHAEKLAKTRWLDAALRTFDAPLWPLPPRSRPSPSALVERVCPLCSTAAPAHHLSLSLSPGSFTQGAVACLHRVE
jgi:hypothetical protein